MRGRERVSTLSSSGGSALYDFLNPDRIRRVDDPHAAHRAAARMPVSAEVVVMNAASAELVKRLERLPAIDHLRKQRRRALRGPRRRCSDVLGSVGRDAASASASCSPVRMGRFVLPEGHRGARRDRGRRRPPVHARAGVDGSERVASSMDRRPATRFVGATSGSSGHALGRHLQGGHR